MEVEIIKTELEEGGLGNGVNLQIAEFLAEKMTNVGLETREDVIGVLNEFMVGEDKVSSASEHVLRFNFEFPKEVIEDGLSEAVYRFVAAENM